MGAIKIIVMGAGGVGKSAVTCRYAQGEWVEKYDPTIEDQYTKTIELDGKAMQLEILDTAGQEEYSPLRSTFMHTGHAFILVYSVTDDETFEELEAIRAQILDVHQNPDVPMIVVGNKIDLEDDRAVTTQEGQSMATSWNSALLEISAKTNEGVTDMFETIIRKVMQLNPEAGGGEGTGMVLGAGATQATSEEAGERVGKKKKRMCTLL